jgi:outer membrane protein TolC
MNTFYPKLLLIIISLLSVNPINAQDQLQLDACRKMAKENFPKLKQTELIQRINELKVENNKSAYLPQVDLKGQATYQSEVTSFDIDLSRIGVTMPSMSKDQYKVYLDLKQTIWDGGMTNSKNQLEKASLESDLQKLEVEAYQLNSVVDAYFFNLLIIRQNEQVLNEQIGVVAKQVERLENANKQGAARQKDVEKLIAEKLLLVQKLTELASKRQSVVSILSILTGSDIKPDAVPQLPQNGLAKADDIKRPEFKLFELQQKQLMASDKLLSSSRNPLVFGFGQAGYGRPGLNMLSNDFSPYYMVGVGVSWHVLDWQNASRNKKANSLQREVIGTLQTDFEQKQQIQLADASSQLANLKQLVTSDEEIINLRKKITKRSASELENGVITSTDYVSDLSAETVALLNYESHKIQLVQATVNYNNILGK